MLLPFLWLSLTALLTRPASADYVSTDYDKYNNGQLGHHPQLFFRSSQEYSPVLQVNVWNETGITSTGSHIFLRHDEGDEAMRASPLILDAKDLSAVFINRTFENVFGTRVQENYGKKYLTFWEGKKGGGVGDGFGLVYDDNYRLVYNVSAPIATHTDLHEFALTGNGTALVTGVDKVMADTTGWSKWHGLSSFRVLDALFQEIDLETNEVIFSWRALDHIDAMDSYERMAKDWDIFHMNSVQKTQDGNYLVSIRHIHSIILVNGKTGDIIWRLGGKRNDFVELPPPEHLNMSASVLSMGWQHHARYLPGTNETEMTFFDNHVKITSHGKCGQDCSRGLHIAVDDSVWPPTVRLMGEYQHPTRLQAQSQGSIQPLNPKAGDISNVFIGWGRCPSFTEHTPDGEAVMDVQFSPWHSSVIPDALDNYRAYKLDWSATPWWGPSIALRRLNSTDIATLDDDDDVDAVTAAAAAAEDAANQLIVYVSWNGATEVGSWVVRGGEGKGSVLAQSPRTGFETRMTVGLEGLRRVWAEALDKTTGEVIRSTEVLTLDGPGGNATLSLKVDENDEFDMISSAAPEDYVTPWTTYAWMAGGLIGLALTTVGAVWLWRRREYMRLDADDLDSNADTEMSSVIGADDFADYLMGGEEAYEDYNTAPKRSLEANREAL